MVIITDKGSEYVKPEKTAKKSAAKTAPKKGGKK